MSKIELVIAPRERDIGGLQVRRILPYATHRMVGPFIFFDHIGPALFHLNEGMDVRPHPHIGLSTVTYLFEGSIRHRDSLGFDQLIEPGAINWMTSGMGIVHSERTPEKLRKTGSKVNGIQCWVALPEEHEDTEPSFAHHPRETLPEFEITGSKLKLLLGSAFDRKSPVKVHSQLFYLETHIPKGARLKLPVQGLEAAAYLIQGEATVNGKNIDPFNMAVSQSGQDLEIEASQDTHMMLLGGQPVGKRFIYWNFVSSSQEKIENAKRDWSLGPQSVEGTRFKTISGDDSEYIPLPEEINPKGTIM